MTLSKPWILLKQKSAMTYLYTNDSVLLSDALERAYGGILMGNPHPSSLRKGARAAGRALRRAAHATARFVTRALNAQAEARVRGKRYGHVDW